MMTYYRTGDQVIHEEEKLSDGVWVQMINPTHDECEEIAEKLMVDIDDVKAALDVEESSRIELQDGYTLILVDIPAIEIRHDQRTYTTIPLGIILTQDIIVTILHGGYTGIAELCAKPCERIQHKEEASFCVSDPVPDSSNLSGKSPDHR